MIQSRASVLNKFRPSVFRNYEDVYSDPGSPLTRRTQWGTYILAKVDGQRKLLLEVWRVRV